MPTHLWMTRDRSSVWDRPYPLPGDAPFLEKDSFFTIPKIDRSLGRGGPSALGYFCVSRFPLNVCSQMSHSLISWGQGKTGIGAAPELAL